MSCIVLSNDVVMLLSSFQLKNSLQAMFFMGEVAGDAGFRCACLTEE
jgi:hypothetical protein